MMSYTYPYSRISSSGDCNVCRGEPGRYQECGILTLPGVGGKEAKLLQISCNYCGHTMLFDLSSAKNSPYRGDGHETIPDFEAKR
jgi:hypothetical protein